MDTKRDNPFLSHGLASTTLHPLGLEVSHAEGPWIFMKDGTKLFDAICGIGVSNFGHGNQEIKGAIGLQLDRHLHTMVYGEFLQESQMEASRLLRSTLPPHLDAVYFVNSGAEAVEAGLKLAKRVTGRSRLMGVEGGYHGNTHGALSVSSNESRKSAYRPMLPEVEFLKWNDLDDVSRIDNSVAAVVLETIQGDAGVRIPSSEWLSAIRAQCTATETMFILDEIQCGMGRTGMPWAFQHFPVLPDMVCMGKALGGGMPIGALTAPSKLMSQFAFQPSLGHITTFGGHPLVCAGASGALQCLQNLNYKKLEMQCEGWANQLRRHRAVKDVRRIGAFFAIELDSAEAVERTVQAGLKCTTGVGVLLFWFLSVPNAFRLAPPLNASDEEMNRGLNLIMHALDQA